MRSSADKVQTTKAVTQDGESAVEVFFPIDYDELES